MTVKLKKGVDTYNLDNKENLDNENNYCPSDDNSFHIQSLGIASYEALSPLDFSQTAETKSLSLLEATAPTPLSADQIKSCVYQLFDNGEQALQRYKFKIRFNLTDGTNPEFIASLTKDFRNFKKYIPESYREQTIDMVKQIRTEVKQAFGHYPYCGKLHFKTNIKTKGATNQIEPNTFVIVWWNPEDKGWSGYIKFQNWTKEFDLFEQYLTAKQRAMGVKCQDNWQNPKYDKKVRPLTWAEQRGIK
jgi:hypothetical protein